MPEALPTEKVEATQQEPDPQLLATDVVGFYVGQHRLQERVGTGVNDGTAVAVSPPLAIGAAVDKA